MSASTPDTAPHSPYAVNATWLALHKEEILEPGLPIVDAHHHLWDKAFRYFLDDFLVDVSSGHNVLASVFVQCNSMYRAEGPPELAPLGETEFVNGIAAMSASGQYGPTRVAAGIVGHADLTLGRKVGDVLDRHLAVAPDRFRGVRHSTVWHPDERITTPIRPKPPEGMLLQPSLREGFAELAKRQLTFDAWLYFTQLADLVDLARAFPETRIVLNHLGGIIGIDPYRGRRDEVFATWKQRIVEVATCENVTVKLGGLGMRLLGFDFSGRERPPSSVELAKAWKPYIETCIEAFGPARCMFESNFPVDKESCSYAVLWNAFKRLASGCSADEKRALFAGTATNVYRLPVGI